MCVYYNVLGVFVFVWFIAELPSRREAPRERRAWAEPHSYGTELIRLGGETSASEQKGGMQWTGTLLRNVACFRLR